MADQYLNYLYERGKDPSPRPRQRSSSSRLVPVDTKDGVTLKHPPQEYAFNTTAEILYSYINNYTVVFVGPTGSGKTTAAVSYMEVLLSDVTYKALLVFSPTAAYSGDLESLLERYPETRVYKYPPKSLVMHKLLEARQAEIIRHAGHAWGTAEGEEWAKQNKQIWFIDDSTGELSLEHNKGILSKLSTKARHIGITVVLCIHHFNAFSQVLKSNVCAVVGFKIRAVYLDVILKDFPDAKSHTGDILVHLRGNYNPVLFIYNPRQPSLDAPVYLEDPF